MARTPNSVVAKEVVANFAYAVEEGIMREPRMPANLEDLEGPLDDKFYADVLYELAGQLGPMNDFYVPLIDASKLLRRG